MNQDQFLGMLRSLVAVGGGYAIGRGWLNSEQVTLLSGVVAAVVPFVWSFYAHTDGAKIQAVTAMPDVKKIVTVANPSNEAVKAASVDVSQPKVGP